jgi:hypothetical protein
LLLDRFTKETTVAVMVRGVLANVCKASPGSGLLFGVQVEICFYLAGSRSVLNIKKFRRLMFEFSTRETTERASGVNVLPPP